MKTRISGDGYTHTHIHTCEVKLSKKKKKKKCQVFSNTIMPSIPDPPASGGIVL